MTETLAGSRIQTFMFDRLGLVPGGLTRYPGEADLGRSPDRGLVFREMSPPVPLKRSFGGHVTMVRSVWRAFVYGRGATREGLKPTADQIVEAVLGAGIVTIDGWRIQGADMTTEVWSTDTYNGVQYRNLGGEFKIVASRQPIT